MERSGTSIVVAGAGSIGGYAGGCLALAGRRVTLLARPRIAEAIAANGLAVTDLDGTARTIARDALSVTDDPTALADAAVILVTVKSGQTAEMAELIATYGRPGAVVVSLQNGVDNVAVLGQRLGPEFTVVAGMVPFNVVQGTGDGRLSFDRTTSGTTLVGDSVEGLAAMLNVDGFPVNSSSDMHAVQWGKLVINLNNGINALSGLTLVEQLSSRRWRRVLADQIAEAMKVLRKAGIQPARFGPLPPAVIPFVLRLPDALFRLVARRMLTVDPKARLSMWKDLEQRRSTEIDYLQGAIIRLAARSGGAAPLSHHIAELVHEAERRAEGSPHLPPEALRDGG